MILFSKRRRDDTDAARRIYAAIVGQARNPVFFRDWNVPDSLDGRFEMLALHIFIVTERLMEEDGDLELARRVSEEFFADMDASFREMGVGDLSVPKRIKSLYRSFGGRLQAYGAGLRGDPDALVAAIDRNVFPDRPAGDAPQYLSAYIRETLTALRRAGLSELRTGAVPFPSPGGGPALEGARP